MAARAGIGLCWLVFVGFWVLSAAATKRTVERPAGQAVYRVFQLVAYALLWLGFDLRRAGVLEQRLLPHSPVLAVTGVLIAAAGVALAIWARATLGTNWSATVTRKENHTLVQGGPYRVVRHPIYTAILMLFIGTAVAIGTVGTVAALPFSVVSILIKAPQEERLMTTTFPDEYAAYKSRTKMLVPLVF